MITHRSFGLKTRFDARGITVTPLLSSGVSLRWSEIERINVTPAMHKDERGWRVDAALVRHFPALEKGAARVTLDLVIRDRDAVVARSGGAWNRAWARSNIRAMTHLEGCGLLSLYLRLRRLDHPLDALMDLIASSARLELLVFEP